MWFLSQSAQRRHLPGVRKSIRTGSTGTGGYIEQLIQVLNNRKLIIQKEREKKKKKEREKERLYMSWALGSVKGP